MVENILMNGFPITISDRLRSIWNRLAFQLRNLIAFSRKGYLESPTSPEQLEKWLAGLNSEAKNIALEIEKKYDLKSWQPHLNLANYQKNLATLWQMEQLLGSITFPKNQTLKIIEAGAQDFARLPGISQYFSTRKHSTQITGLELDAYQVLEGAHSRFDLAQYYCGKFPGPQYSVGDFFHLEDQFDLFLSFYPFVSPHPALAWGLPMEFGDAKLWVEGLMRNVKPDGYALVIQQGDWEEKEFDAAMPFGAFRLQLLERKIVTCPFLPSPHPAHGSVYQLVLS